MLKVEIIKDGAGFFRWTLVSAGHRTVATSAERFTSMESCWRSAQQLKTMNYGAPIEDLTLAAARPV
jgi:uncharacterized protein YegP (UPF0339 family)